MKKHRSLFQAALAVSIIAILSKLLGFCREMLIANYFGATAETDAFFFAQDMPGMVFPAVGNSIATAFVSLYTAKCVANGEDGESDRYATRMLLFTTCLAVFLTVIGEFVSPVFASLFAPGFTERQMRLAIRLTRLTMSTFTLVMLQYMLSAILNSQKLFIGSQMSALLYNIVIISVTLLFGRGQRIETLTLTVILGSFAQVVGLAVCCRGHLRLMIRLDPLRREIGQLLRLSGPILLGNSVVQINLIVDKALSSGLPEGSLSALSYGSALCRLVTAVLISSMSTVLHPLLTQYVASGDMDKYNRSLEESLCGLTCVLVPISCITVLSARDIVYIVYGHGSFDGTAVGYTAAVLAFYAPMFVGTGIREVLTRAFYAMQDTMTPMRNASVGVVCNIILSIVLVRWLGVGGIALGTALSSFITSGLLLAVAYRRIASLDVRACMVHLFKQILAGAAAIAILMLCRRMMVIPIAFVRFVVSTVVGGSVYFAVLTVLDKSYVLQLLRMLMPRHNGEDSV